MRTDPWCTAARGHCVYSLPSSPPTAPPPTTSSDPTISVCSLRPGGEKKHKRKPRTKWSIKQTMPVSARRVRVRCLRLIRKVLALLARLLLLSKAFPSLSSRRLFPVRDASGAPRTSSWGVNVGCADLRMATRPVRGQGARGSALQRRSRWVLGAGSDCASCPRPSPAWSKARIPSHAPWTRSLHHCETPSRVRAHSTSHSSTSSLHTGFQEGFARDPSAVLSWLWETSRTRPWVCARAPGAFALPMSATQAACHTSPAPLTHPHPAFYYSKAQPARISHWLYLARILVLVFTRLLPSSLLLRRSTTYCDVRVWCLYLLPVAIQLTSLARPTHMDFLSAVKYQ